MSLLPSIILSNIILETEHSRVSIYYRGFRNDIHSTRRALVLRKTPAYATRDTPAERTPLHELRCVHGAGCSRVLGVAQRVVK